MSVELSSTYPHPLGDEVWPKVGPDVHTAAMGRIDGCPECVINSEAPYEAAETPHTFTAFYRCSDCGHRWFTSWKKG